LEIGGGLLIRSESAIYGATAPVANRRAGFHPAPQSMQTVRFREE
jgi:hypothetical protein